jgi:hypothetical protein
MASRRARRVRFEVFEVHWRSDALAPTLADRLVRACGS